MREAWITAKLGELCDIQLGKTPARADSSYWDQERSTGNVWLSIADLLRSEENKVSDSKEYLSEKGAALCKIVKKGTLLVSFKLTLGRVAFAGKDLYTNEAIAALIVRDERIATREYLFYFLRFFDWVKAARDDVKLKGMTLNKAKLKEIVVGVPPLPEQKRIVAILDEAFAGIETAITNTEKNLANARELFVSQRNSIFADSERPWTSIRLDELCSIKHGFAFKSEHFATEGDYVLLTPGSFWENGGFRDQGGKTKYYHGEIPEGFLLSEGDFLIAMTEQAAGLLGSSLIVPTSGRYLHNQRLGRVVVPEHIDWHNDFFFHQFNTDKFRSSVQTTASGVKVRHTSPKKLGEIQVKVPPNVSEQIAVAQHLNALQREIRIVERSYNRKRACLLELKQSLLQKAFSGELTADRAEEELESATA